MAKIKGDTWYIFIYFRPPQNPPIDAKCQKRKMVTRQNPIQKINAEYDIKTHKDVQELLSSGPNAQS